MHAVRFHIWTIFAYFVYSHSLMIFFTVMALVVFIHLTLAVLGLQGCMGFSLVGVTRGYSLGAMLRASHYRGFSCCREWSLG